MKTRFETQEIVISVDDILRGQGADPQKVSSRTPALVQIAESAQMLGADLIMPQMVMNTFSRNDLMNGEMISSDLALKNLACLDEKLDGAISFVVVICTVGGELEKLSSSQMVDDFALALALDGMANAAIDRLAEIVFREICDEAEAEGLGASLPVSPGGHTWPLEIGQPFIFELLAPQNGFVQLTESFLMLPKKSTSFIVGVGPDMKRHGKTCDFCSMTETCRYKLRKSI